MLADVIKEHGGVEVDAMTVYRDMFRLGDGLIQKCNEPSGEFKSNPIGYFRNFGQSKGQYRILFDDTFEETLQELQDADFAIINGVTYFGRKNLQRHAGKMYAMIFDLDGVTDETLTAFLGGCFVEEYDIYPVPNYVILSGHGVHLYYIFDYPVPLYPNLKLQLKNLKYALTEKMWNRYTSTIKQRQYQGINQGFRPIGGKTKIEGVRVRAFQLSSHPCTLGELANYVPDEFRIDESKLYKESKLTLAKAKQLYPQWYNDRVLNKADRRYWEIKPDLYNWWKRQIQKKSSYGHRYFAIMCLAIYGAKCNIPFEQVQSDALSLLPLMNIIEPAHPFLQSDVFSALECYDKRYCTFPICDIEKLSGIPIKRNKRNGRTQAEHIKLMNFVRDEINHNTDWRKLGGRKSKQVAVEEWQRLHPDGRKVDCIRGTGLGKTTVNKWWQKKEMV